MLLKNHNRQRQPTEMNEHLLKDFRLRAPYALYRPLSYQVSGTFTNFKTVIDLHIKKLLAGEIDAGNANALDSLVADAARQAESELTHQRRVHTDQIQTFQHRRLADQLSFELERHQLQDKLDQANQERSALLLRLQSQKFRKEAQD